MTPRSDAPASGVSHWLVTGSGGQLGRCLVERLRARGVERLDAPSRDELDITDADALRAALLAGSDGPPGVVVNAAAMTAVDRCETEPAEAARVNGEAPGWLAELCGEVGARLVHVSTDYVFDGCGQRPYRETDPTAPRSEYGRSKLEGERRVREALPSALIVRTAWVFGPGRNFVRTILRAAHGARERGGPPLRVVDDQRGSPTYAGHLADGILALVERGAAGLYHLANTGNATWWDLARAAVDAWGHPEIPIEKVSTAAFPRPAPRPAWSVLDVGKAAGAGVTMPSWQAGLRAYLEADPSPLAELGAREGTAGGMT